MLLLVYFSAGLVYTQAQEPAPVKKDVDKFLTVTNADYDMGKIAAGKPLEYNLVIRNISRDTLVLQDVKVGCGCTTPKFRAGEKILPGKSTYIVLGFNGDAHGEFVKTADIIFAGGLNKQVKFHGVTFTDSTAAPKTILN